MIAVAVAFVTLTVGVPETVKLVTVIVFQTVPVPVIVIALVPNESVRANVPLELNNPVVNV